MKKLARDGIASKRSTIRLFMPIRLSFYVYSAIVDSSWRFVFMLRNIPFRNMHWLVTNYVCACLSQCFGQCYCYFGCDCNFVCDKKFYVVLLFTVKYRVSRLRLHHFISATKIRYWRMSFFHSAPHLLSGCTAQKIPSKDLNQVGYPRISICGTTAADFASL